MRYFGWIVFDKETKILTFSMAYIKGLDTEISPTEKRSPVLTFNTLNSVNWFGDFVALYCGGYAQEFRAPHHAPRISARQLFNLDFLDRLAIMSVNTIIKS
jgi:hypothetical protein